MADLREQPRTAQPPISDGPRLGLDDLLCVWDIPQMVGKRANPGWLGNVDSSATTNLSALDPEFKSAISVRPTPLQNNRVWGDHAYGRGENRHERENDYNDLAWHVGASLF